MTSSYRRDQSGKLLLSREQALEIRDEYALDKNFWVYDMEENKEFLQAALDILNNTVEGNQYYVDYMEMQNNSRLAITCDPCNKQLSSYDPFMSHDQGKNHKKCIQLKINRLEAERIAQKEISFKPLNTPKGIFDPLSLEDMLDQCNSRVLGLQFLYKEKLHGHNSSFRFTCQLCNVKRINKAEMFAHLTEDTLHNRKYITVKFNRHIATTDVYDIKCKEIEILEGKVNHTIVDFTQQVEMLRNCNGDATTPPSSPPPSPTHHSLSPSKASPAPAAPLVTHAEVQVNTDELDVDLSMVKELAMLKLNDGPKHLSEDFEALELMLETLQTLNLKMHSFYRCSHPHRTTYTAKYQGYVNKAHASLKKQYLSVEDPKTCNGSAATSKK